VPSDPGFFISQDSFGENAPIDRQGNFSWKNVTTGTYVLQIFGGDGKEISFLKAAHIGARNLDGEFPLSGSTTLDLVVSTKTATLEGVVTDRDPQGSDAPVPNVTVVAVPAEKYRKITTRFGVSATDQYGRFTIYGLTPGSYTVFAWQDMDHDLYNDPDFLKSQETNSTPVKLDEGSNQKLDLKLSPVAEEWR
jgi:hypothetical protein